MPTPVAPVSATAPQKTSAVVWILGGCGGLVVLAALVGGIAMYYVAHKAKQFGRNPALAITRMIAAANPDVDVVSTDEDKGTITVRDRKTGKTVTMNFADAQKGKFVFEQDGQKVQMEAHGEGDKGSFEVKSSEGSMKFQSGAGSEKLPDWLPAYPGSSPQGAFSMQNPKETTGSFSFVTKDSIEQVMRYYEGALKKAGLKVTSNTMQQDGRTNLGVVTAEEAGNKRKAVVNATASPEGINVGVTFTAPR
ncbi:MAG TPA: hypothetical protein VNH83_11030 [Bryobacteraceae bacterium]|nr:hypothetical protein [Bryobacteraceae bacterium]